MELLLIVGALTVAVCVGTIFFVVRFGKRVDQKLIGAQEDSERVRQIEELRKEFLQMIAHDVRTPLTSLQTVLAMLSKGSYGTLTDKGVERVAQAEQSLAYVINLLNQLFEVEKLTADEELPLEYSIADIKQTCEKSIEIVKPFADLKQINLNLETDSISLEADHGRISQVILNLVSNAIKHSPAESSIRISVEKSSDSMHMRISDEGPGLERDLRTKAFDRFTQFGDPAGGMGLGLAISKAIIEAHRGDIGFESQYGKGCTIWFRLPLARPALSTAAND